MKIRLTDDEVYEIKMPEEIGVNEFSAIVTKFNFLLKNFAKFDMVEKDDENGIVLNKEQNNIRKTHNKNKWNFLKENRNAFVEILKTHYLKSKEEFFEILNKHNLNIKKAEMCSSQMIRLREYHKLQPNEVGLTDFPSLKKQVSECLLNQGEN